MRGKGGSWVLVGVLKALCEVAVVHGVGKGKVMWSGPEIIVTIGLGRKKSMQYVLFVAQNAAEQCVIIVILLLPLRHCLWSIQGLGLLQVRCSCIVKLTLKLLLLSTV